MSQPIDEYPNPDMSTRQPADSSHSNGSFGPVLAVLAVIVVVSAVACVVGRLCSKRGHRVKEAAHHPSKVQSGGLGPKEWESRQKPNFNMKNGDIEFGLDKRMPSGKEGKKGGGKPNKSHPNPPHQHKPEVRF